MGEPTFTPGKWNWWTSCSWKRLRSDLGGGKDVSVVEPFVSRSDGHPDLMVSDTDMALIAAAPEMFEALTALYASVVAGRSDADLIVAFGDSDLLHAVSASRAALLKASHGGTKDAG